MSLYTKTLLIIAGVLLTLAAILYFVSQGILVTSYYQLEEQQVEQNVQRALNAISSELNQLSIQNSDYAHWDDSYVFVQNGNQLYINSNLGDSTFTSLGINLIAFINNQGKVVFAKTVDLETGRAYPVPPDLYDYFNPQSPLLNLPEGEQGTNGIILLEGVPMLISSEHILTSELEGPKMGMLVMGYLLDETRIQHLSDTLQLSLILQPADAPDVPADFHTAKSALFGGAHAFIKPLDDSRTAGYTSFNDLGGAPALILRVDLERDIFAQGQSTLSFFLIATLVISLVFTVAVLASLERLVLSRLSRLSSSLSAVRSSADFSRRMTVDGSDELAGLAANINATLEALAGAQNQLRHANEELDARVQERTRELSTTNLQLAEEIVQHQQTQAKLAGARDQAIEALNLKTQLLANISHDSRTPLTVMMLRTEMLRDARYGAVNEKQIETLDSILMNGRQLLGFINNLLSESQARAKTMRIKSDPFRPADLLRDVMLTAAPLVERKALNFETDLDAGLPETVCGDRERLNQILMNLVENAVKFTNTGGISIRFFQPDTTKWALQVKDTGVGIPSDAQERIFDAFWQVDGSLVREANQGVGLGLSIVKQLTTLMKGEIGLDSSPGQGSTFTITLPLLQPKKDVSDEQALVYSDR